MTDHSESRPSSHRIKSERVAADARASSLPHHFGEHTEKVQRRIFAVMKEFAPEYHGGYWHLYNLSNGGFYMAPTHDVLMLSVPEKRFTGTMTGDTAGIIVCLYSLYMLALESSTPLFALYHYRLLDFALEHREAAMIFAVID